jgi:hypothetical protein
MLTVLRSARAAEQRVALGQEVPVGLEVFGARQVDAPALEALEAVLEHGPVDLLKHVEAHRDLEVGRDADHVGIERGVMQLSGREAVGDHRLAERVNIGKDVGGLQQLVMAEPADGAALLIGAEHALAKAALVQALPDQRSHILPPRSQRRRVVDLPGGRRVDLGVDRHDEGEGLGVILDDEDRSRRLIEALDDAVQVDEERLARHGRRQRCLRLEDSQSTTELHTMLIVTIENEPTASKLSRPLLVPEVQR